MKQLVGCLLLVPMLALAQGKRQIADNKMVLTTIAMGSCNDVRLPMPLWSDIIRTQPQLWLWLGDNVYSDDDVKNLRPFYSKLKNDSAYTQLRQRTRIIGHWDDHDYAKNDGGKENVYKDSAKAALLDFLEVPVKDPVRKRPGVYQSYTFGPRGRQVKVIMLDNRWFRDKQPRDTTKKYKAFLANPEGDILGEEQWQWLEQELKNSKAQIHIISNGIQVLAPDHHFEKWANFPKARARLITLLAKYKRLMPGVVLLSGDRHVAEVSRLDTTALGHPLYDITVSGLTHVYDKLSYEPNRLRVPQAVLTASNGIVNQLHFGLFKIDWQKRTLEWQAVGRGGAVLARHMLTF